MENVDIEELIKDRKAFNDFVYTPVDEAVQQIKLRRENFKLPDFSFVPEVFKKAPRVVMFRQLVTPNYEITRFMGLSEVTSLKPLFFEYYHDKFTSNNELKHSLGRLFFYKGRGKDGRAMVDSLNIIDFNKSNGHTISSVKTLWGQSLIKFHHKLFRKRFVKQTKDIFFDASQWFAKNGSSAAGYYKSFLSLFVKDGILFENFMLDYKEVAFTKEIFLPAFIAVMKETGHKPLIVALEPTEMEEDRFWMSHPPEDKIFVDYKMSSIFKRILIKLKSIYKYLVFSVKNIL